MKILISNDDGYQAPGIVALYEALSELGDVEVVAPEQNNSSKSNALTLHSPLYVTRAENGFRYVNGTPADCVHIALTGLLDYRPDLVVSGINRGANLGDDVTYSGTVSAAFEGALAGIRSIALSQVYAREGEGDAVPFEAAEIWGERVLAPLLDASFAPRTLVNINFPPVAAHEVRGIRVVRQGFHDYARGSVVEGRDPRGFHYYWFGLHGIEHTPGHATDLEAIADGFVSVTPLQLDFTHEASLAALEERFQ